ncbi:hypothetical protein M8J76_013184 [Diaphorina citri]|nr:hypothetical protein M8J76_013184 [Diaphorina citri]
MEFYLNVLSEDYDVIAIVESWLTSGVNSGELFDPRYQVFRQDRDPVSAGKSKGGGLIIAVKNNIKALPLTSLNQCERHIESLWVKCNIHGQDIILSLCYFPPPVKAETMEIFADSICQIEELNGNKLICLGDFNIPIFHPPGIEPPDTDISIPDNLNTTLNPNPDQDNIVATAFGAGTDDNNIREVNPQVESRGALLHLHKVINFYDLESLNNVKNHNGRTLDLCLTNFNSNKISRKKVAKCHIEESDGLVKIDSHHPPLVLFIGTHKSWDNTNYAPVCPIQADLPFNFNKTDFISLKDKLNSLNWDNVYRATDPNEKMKMFYANLEKAFLLSVPLVNKNTKQNKFPKWWHKDTISTFKRKERIRKIRRKSAVQTSVYNTLRKLCKAAIKRDHQIYINKITTLVKKGNSKPFWDFTKQQSKEPPKKLLTYKNEQISEPQHIVNAFAEHFLGAYNQTPPCYDTNFNIETNPEYFHLSIITEQDIVHEVKRMKINKPAGPDGIPPKILSNCIAQLKAPLAHIFTHSVQCGIFPSALKVSNNGFLNRRRRTEVKSSVELIGESDWKGKYKRYHLSAIHH